MVAGGADSASGQARPITIDVLQSPDPAQVGDDVTATIAVEGCPGGEIVAQVLRETDDGEVLEAALMAQVEGTSSADRSALLEVTMSDAYRGWYGVRVVCGEYRGPQRALPGSYFQVGMNDRIRATLSATTVKPGGSLTLSGDSCRGSSVEYDITQMSIAAPIFDPEGSIPVGPDGTWSAPVPYPKNVGLGRTDMDARCVMTNERGEVFHDYYDRPEQVIVG